MYYCIYDYYLCSNFSRNVLHVGSNENTVNIYFRYYWTEQHAMFNWISSGRFSLEIWGKIVGYIKSGNLLVSFWVNQNCRCANNTENIRFKSVSENILRNYFFLIAASAYNGIGWGKAANRSQWQMCSKWKVFIKRAE